MSEQIWEQGVPQDIEHAISEEPKTRKEWAGCIYEWISFVGRQGQRLGSEFGHNHTGSDFISQSL